MIPRRWNENVADGTELLVRDVRFPAANGGEPDMDAGMPNRRELH